jgi:anaerobic selenocysteine-containing dehydrogenase
MSERRIDRIAEPWGTRTPFGPGETWPVREDMHLEDGARPDAVQWVETASILHSNGDALEIAVRDGRMVGVRGIGRSRVNHGRLGPKDLYGWQANGSPDRLTRPLVRRRGELVATDWDTAMGAVVARSQELLREAGPSSIAFYTSGQLFLEEYYTQAVIGRAGIGTNHIDGNTRLCTATAGEALKESFGCDGQPGSYTDVDHADVIAMYGHNPAETQAVLWMRVLDRLEGPNPPALICVDPRPTEVARHATVHLAVRNGTNLALLNALVHEVIANGWVDESYVAAHAVGFDELRQRTETCTPEWAADICGVDAGAIREAARLIGTAERLLQTVLQGVYQSHQATAAACQVNNLAILRGMLGRAGSSVLQMNGQPTAQNTRETGANGDLPAFRNWANDDHVAELARIWNVDPLQIPHWGPSTHAMEIFRHAEEGSIRMLWITATNPAVSLPELHRIRSLLGQERLFLVVQDVFPTETTSLADVVLPAATWGEKLGTFTNADRTVHVSDKAVDPPGEAKPDLDIFLDYARRMDFRDRDGQPLIKWHDPESAFEAWKACSKGRVRLLGHHVRAAAGDRRDAVGRRAPLCRRRVLRGSRDVRDLRARPADRRLAGRDRVPGAQSGGKGDPQGGGVRAAARGADGRAPAAPEHRAHALPLPHPDEDRTCAAAPGRCARGVGRTGRGRRAGTRARRGRRRRDRVAARGTPGARARHGAARGRRVRTVPLRILGPRRRSRPRRERAHHHRVGPRLQAAPVQGRGVPGDEGRGRRRPAGARPDDHRLTPCGRRRSHDPR